MYSPTTARTKYSPAKPTAMIDVMISSQGVSRSLMNAKKLATIEMADTAAKKRNRAREIRTPASVNEKKTSSPKRRLVFGRWPAARSGE